MLLDVRLVVTSERKGHGGLFQVLAKCVFQLVKNTINLTIL